MESLRVREPVFTGTTSAPSSRITHVDHALQAQQRAGSCGGDPVLAGSSLRDHPRFAHPLGEQRLTQHIVDLV
jgi:predicted HD phosphohydrolase